MGYDVHITRAEHWADNEGREIAPDEWLVLVRSDPELMPTPENGEYVVIWHGTTKYPETWFDWCAGNITTTYPDRATLNKMFQLATALEAKVQGDDGEVYDEVSIENFDDSFINVDPSGTQPGQHLEADSGLQFARCSRTIRRVNSPDDRAGERKSRLATRICRRYDIASDKIENRRGAGAGDLAVHAG